MVRFCVAIVPRTLGETSEVQCLTFPCPIVEHHGVPISREGGGVVGNER